MKSPDLAARAAARRASWIGGKAPSHEALDAADLDFWQAATPSDRLNAVWQMALESLTITEAHEPAPRLKDLLAVFADEGVRYLLVGGYAVSFHSRPRYTKDIDLWIADDPENLARVERALVLFGAPESVLDGLRSLGPEEILYMGAPPVRVDILKQIPGVDFATAYPGRVETTWEGTPVTIIGAVDLIAAKRASGRPQDLLDVTALLKALKRS